MGIYDKINESCLSSLSPDSIFSRQGQCYITKTRLFKYIENFTSKNWKFSDEYSDIFHISAQNIDCGYSLEPPRFEQK